MKETTHYPNGSFYGTYLSTLRWVLILPLDAFASSLIPARSSSALRLTRCSCWSSAAPMAAAPPAPPSSTLTSTSVSATEVVSHELPAPSALGHWVSRVDLDWERERQRGGLWFSLLEEEEEEEGGRRAAVEEAVEGGGAAVQEVTVERVSSLLQALG